MHNETNSLPRIVLDGEIKESTLTERRLIIGELLKERRKHMVKIGTLEEKNEMYGFKSWISSSQKKQGLSLLTMHDIVSPNKILMS